MSRPDKSDDEDLWTTFKKEFHIENFSLNFEKNSRFLKKEPEVVLEYFHTTIWPCCNRLVYLIYRIAIAIYYTIWFVESIIRNAEFISKDIKMKNKIHIFSIHPWPLYMTSWSLTILFAHLWICAFISLYFYSINEKSYLATIFLQLFGPFSCSRLPRKKFKQKSCFSGLNLRSLFTKKSVDTQTGRPKILDTNTCEPTIKINLLKKPVTLTIENSNAACDSDLNHQVVFISDEQNSQDRQLANNCPLTYCDIPVYHLCSIPSSVVISNAESWKLWINTHVPNFVLILIKIDWLLNNLVAISALIVTCIYFGYAYLVDLEAEPTWAHELGNMHRHGINSLVALVDVIMLGYPIRILHFVYVIIYGWVYAFVTFIYWFQNPKENVIYDQINYQKPMKMLIGYAFLTLLVFLMQITHFLAYRLKVLIKVKYFDKGCECLSATDSLTPNSHVADVNLNAQSTSENATCKV